jgi:aminoglycoside phosphotransferase (APT) family kinase protein
MDKEFVNQELEFAAKRTLTHLTGSEDSLTPLYLQPDRALFLAENLRIIFKVSMEEKTLQHEYAIAQKVASIGVPIPEILGFEAGQPAVLAMKQVMGHPLSSHTQSAAKEAGNYLQRFHTLGAHPPFSGGQQQWAAFISWWANEEIEKVKRLAVLDHQQIRELHEQFETLRPLLVQRPIVLLHGDLQTAHILVDPQTEKVLAFLDFADAQPGDPLLDLAVVTLWDQELTDFFLEGYSSIEHTTETKQVLSLYRLLRRLAEIPWLVERGFLELAARNITALKDALRAWHHSKALPCMSEHALRRADEIRTPSPLSSHPNNDGGSVRQSDAGGDG